MLSKEEQKARLAELRAKAEAKGEAHGKIVNKAFITTGQKVSGVATVAFGYANKCVKHSVVDQRNA